MRNYYHSLLEQYIIALENPDSNGWDNKTRTWGHATGKGMDRNQIGIGGDRNNVNIKAITGSQNWEKVRITEAQERVARYKNFDYFNDAYNRNTKGLSLSNRKHMLAMGLLYHGYGRSLWNEKHPLNKALKNGSDEELSRVISEFYSERYPERARNHNKFMERLKKADEETKKKKLLSLKTISGYDRISNYVAPNDATRVVHIPIIRRTPLSQMTLPMPIMRLK